MRPADVFGGVAKEYVEARAAHHEARVLAKLAELKRQKPQLTPARAAAAAATADAAAQRVAFVTLSSLVNSATRVQHAGALPRRGDGGEVVIERTARRVRGALTLKGHAAVGAPRPNATVRVSRKQARAVAIKLRQSPPADASIVLNRPWTAPIRSDATARSFSRFIGAGGAAQAMAAGPEVRSASGPSGPVHGARDSRSLANWRAAKASWRQRLALQYVVETALAK